MKFAEMKPMMINRAVVATIAASVFAAFTPSQVLAQSQGGAKAGVPTAKDFAMKPTAGLVELGPQGQSVAFLSRQYQPICRSEQYERLPPNRCDADERESAATDRIIIIDVEKMTQHRIIPVPEDFTVNWMEWTSADNLLISITTAWEYTGKAVRPRLGSNVRSDTYIPPVGRILSVSRDGNADPVTLFGDDTRLLRDNLRLSRVVDLLHNDPDHVVMGAYRNSDYDLFRVNVNNGSAERVAKGRERTFAWYTDQNGAPSIRLDCTTASCRSLRAYRPQDGADPNDEKTDWVKFRTIERRQRGDQQTVQEIDWITPTGQPHEYYVKVEGDGHARSSIKIYNVRTDKFVRDVFSDPNYDVGGAVIDPETGRYAGAYVWRDRIEYHLEDAALAKHLKAINAFFDNKWNVSMTGFSNNGELAIVQASAPNDPGAYYLYDFNKREVNGLFGVYDNMPAELDAKTDVLSLPMRDGATITGYHTKPGSSVAAGGTAPLIVMVHGGPEVRDTYSYDRTVQFLASRGYQVLQINYRGSSGYGRKFAQAGYRQWGGTMHHDVIDATRHLVAKGVAAKDKTCIMGYSYGGYAALLAGAQSPDDYVCIIAGAGPTDLYASLKQDRKQYGADSSAFDYWTKSIGDMKTDRKTLAAISPINMASRYDDPILIIHGTDDDIVQVSHSEEMFEALKKANQDVTYLELDEGHFHNFWSIESSEDYFEQIEAFLTKAMPK